MQMNTLASVIILNWNGGHENCLESVESALNQDYPNIEIIFVDNASTDGSFEAVKQKFPYIQFVRIEKNIGCPSGRNVGAQKARGEYLFFLENDGVWESSDTVSSAINFFAQHKDIGALYTKVIGYNTGKEDSPLDLNGKIDETSISSSFRGGASAIRNQLFNNLNGFPNDFFRQGEERFLSLLIYNEGYKVCYWPIRTMRHKGSDYSGKFKQINNLTYENNLKMIVQLYPTSYLLKVLPGKIMIGFLRSSQNMNFSTFFHSLYSIIKKFRTRYYISQVSKKTVNLSEALQFNRINGGSAIYTPINDLKNSAPRFSPYKSRFWSA